MTVFTMVFIVILENSTRHILFHRNYVHNHYYNLHYCPKAIFMHSQQYSTVFALQIQSWCLAESKLKLPNLNYEIKKEQNHNLSMLIFCTLFKKLKERLHGKRSRDL